MKSEELRAIGVVVAAHGLKGALKTQPLTDFAERFDDLKSVYLRRGDDVEGVCHVRRIRWATAFVLVLLDEVDSREAAEDLKGVELCVPDAESWELPKDVYYLSDLIGYAGVSEDGTPVGMLINILSGAQDILEFKGEGESLLVPFVSEWVGKVDQNKRTIEIRNWRLLAEPEVVDTPPETDDH